MNKLLIALLFLSFNVSASNYYHCCTDGVDGVDGVDGTNGADGVVDYTIVNTIVDTRLNSTTTEYQTYATELNSRMDNLNDRANAVGAMGGAFGMLPANSHVSGDHGHLGVSIAGVNYNNANALAAGVNWSVENFNLKGAVSINDDNSDAMIGLGGNWTF